MEKEDQIKEAFQKIKQDINYLKQENNFFRNSIIETHKRISETTEIIKKLTEVNINVSRVLNKLKENYPFNLQKEKNLEIPTHQHIIPTHLTHIKPLNDQIIHISSGNEGVPTDRQTNQQTDKPTDRIWYNPLSTHSQKDKIPLQDVSKILDSLDSLKKEIRLKFKRLTEQELLVFSTVYQLEEERGYTNYKSLSNKLNLTESSIRDYIGKLIKKGIPINKNKINNKNIQISISDNLKKIASLQTILNLKDL